MKQDRYPTAGQYLPTFLFKSAKTEDIDMHVNSSQKPHSSLLHIGLEKVRSASVPRRAAVSLLTLTYYARTCHQLILGLLRVSFWNKLGS